MRACVAYDGKSCGRGRMAWRECVHACVRAVLVHACVVGTPGDPANMFSYTGPAGVKVSV
jgi:hypothetical protein